MAASSSANVKLIKLAVSIASVAAIAGITGRMAGNEAPVGSGEGPVASEAPGPSGFGLPPYRAGDRDNGWLDDWDDDWDDDRDDDYDWEDDRDDDWDDDDDDRGDGDDGPRLWFQPRGGATAGDQAGVRPPRTRTRHS